MLPTAALRRLLRTCLPMLLALASGQVAAALCLSEEAPHPCASLEACRAAVEGDTLDVSARLALCERFAADGQLVEAGAVLRRGLQLCTDRRGLCGVLERALSNVEERRLALERDRSADQLRRRRDALRAYCTGGVTTDRTIAACEELVADAPDAELYAALARKLLAREQPGRAVATLADAEAAGIASPALADLAAEAEAQRARSGRACTDARVLEACDAALLAGAPDEAQLLRVRGEILAGTGAQRQALRAFAAALELGPDRAVGAAILALDPERFARDDLEFHRLRAQAARLLGEPATEMAALRRVVALDANASEARGRLARLTPPEPRPVARPPAEAAERSAGGAATAVVDAADPGPEPAVPDSDGPVAAPAEAPAGLAQGSPPRLLVGNRLTEAGRTH